MKTYILLFALFFCNLVYSQLIIDAGNDTVFCQTANGLSFSIGGNPTAANGIPSYTYTWSIKEPYQIPFSNIILNASDFLDDTTSSNPTIIDGFGILDSMKFYLKVVDSNGTLQKDSLTVGFSIFSLGLENNFFHIIEGDTLFVGLASYVGGGLGTSSYLWQPNHGLIDSTFNHLWTSPSVSTDYFCTVTDDFGCSITTIVMNHVIVHYLNIEELVSINAESVTLFPNPTSGEVYLSFNSSDIRNFSIYDSNMKLIEKVDSKIKKYDLSPYSKGVYVINFEFNNETISKKVILQ